MQRQTLKVVVIDDDGLDVRKEVFEQFFVLEAERAAQRLELVVYTKFPPFSKLEGASVVSWDNDLGFNSELGENSETLRMLRRLQFTGPEYLESLRGKIQLVHSMNPVASANLYTLLSHDLGLKTFVIPFNYMKRRVETEVFHICEPLVVKRYN